MNPIVLHREPHLHVSFPPKERTFSESDWLRDVKQTLVRPIYLAPLRLILLPQVKAGDSDAPSGTEPLGQEIKTIVQSFQALPENFQSQALQAMTRDPVVFLALSQCLLSPAAGRVPPS